jgi:hypothetical protein
MIPMRVELDGGPGSSHFGALQITSQASEPIRIRAEVLDFTLDSEGTPQFQRALPGEASSSCKEWLTVNPMEIDLAAGEQVQARYSIRIPATATAREYHCAVGYTTLPVASKTGPMGMRMAVRLVAAFYVKPGGVKPAPEFLDLSLERLDNSDRDQWGAIALFRNKGLVHFRSKGEIAVFDEAGTEIERLQMPSIPILPEREQRLPVPLKTSLAGKKGKVVARIDLGGEIQEAVITFALPPTAPVPATPGAPAAPKAVAEARR